MAEPLTSSDIIRERMGFGVSPLASDETRRAYAAAGLSPLGTQERQRFEAGGGLSPMATRQEQEAWKQAEFMAGRREQAPISYGGIGDRPIGTSRRDIRMQAEWDKQQQQLLERQRTIQQMENEALDSVSRELDISRGQYEFQALKEKDLFDKAEKERQARGVAGFQKFANQFINQDPRVAYAAVTDVIAENPELSDIPLVKDTIAAYKNRAESGTLALINKEEKALNEARAERQKGFTETYQKLLASGVSQEQIPQFYDPNANVPIGEIAFNPKKVAEQLGGAEAAVKTEAKEKPVKDIELDIKQKSEEFNSMLMAPPQTRSAAFEEGLAEKQAEINGLRARYNSVTGKEAPKFIARPQNKQQYDSLPSGTSYIGRDGKEKIKQ